MTEPSLAPILALHRHEDGYVSFAVARDKGEDFRPLFSIRRDELARYFPEFREQLMRDSYVAINADWHVRRFGPDGRAWGYPLHRTDRLRYLCAAYCDVDYYDLGITFGQALGSIVERQDAGILPKASIIVRSGRGLWLIYLLHDPKDPSRALGAFPEKKEKYFRLQRAIVERLRLIGADPCGTDAARHVRVPGSLHTGSERYAQWWIQGEGPSAYSYDLDLLCKLFGVQPIIRHSREQSASNAAQGPKDPHFAALGHRGWVALNARRLRDFNVLREIRGGFARGCRNNAAMTYAWLLRCNGVPRREGSLLVGAFGAECRPPLTPSECRSAVQTGYSRRMTRMCDSTIADRLGVTPDEACATEGIPSAIRFGLRNPAPMPSEKRAQTIAERRAEIVSIIDKLGAVPPVREMGRRLIEAGFNGNHQTAQSDYQALGIQSGRTRAERNTARSKQLVLLGG